MAGPPIKQFCKHGHDTFVVGRCGSGGCRECNRIRQRRAYPARAEYFSAKARLKDTGWTAEEYQSARARQQYRCAMCGRHEDEFRVALHADHCHATGRKRGLLCTNCNNRYEPVITAYCSDPDLRARWNHYLGVA